MATLYTNTVKLVDEIIEAYKAENFERAKELACENIVNETFFMGKLPEADIKVINGWVFNSLDSFVNDMMEESDDELVF